MIIGIKAAGTLLLLECWNVSYERLYEPNKVSDTLEVRHPPDSVLLYL